LNYVGKDGKKYRPIMLHRVILGSLERFMGTLLEHYKGLLPVWLAPEQVRIIPVTGRTYTYAKKIKQILDAQNIRSNLEARSEKVGYKIRQAEIERIPYMLIVGDKEEKNSTLSLRSKQEGDLGQIKIDKFLQKIKKQIDSYK